MRDHGSRDGYHLFDLESKEELLTLMREQHAWISHTPGSGCYFAHVGEEKVLYYVPPDVMMDVIGSLQRYEMFTLPGVRPTEQAEEEWQDHL